MVNERVQRQIDRLLDQAEEAMGQLDWEVVRRRSQAVLSLQSDNDVAQTYLEAAVKALGEPDVGVASITNLPSAKVIAEPASFAGGRYQVKEFIGEGGKKRVYRAHDSVLDRDVALAVIKTEGLDPTSRVRITREAQAMGRLGDHPHVLSIHDLGEDNGQPYMVLPLMPGGDVGTLLENAEDHKLPLEQAIDLATQICRGLEFAHSNSIVHRDLKPGNIWLTADGTARIGDFGLAVAVDRSRLTQEGMMVGTPTLTLHLFWHYAILTGYRHHHSAPVESVPSAKGQKDFEAQHTASHLSGEQFRRGFYSMGWRIGVTTWADLLSVA